MASKEPIPPVVTIIQHWLDEVQYLPGLFVVKDERYDGYFITRSEWVIMDTLPGDYNYIRFDSEALECRFGHITFSMHDPRFFEKLDWFLMGKWGMILNEWPLKRGTTSSSAYYHGLDGSGTVGA